MYLANSQISTRIESIYVDNVCVNKVSAKNLATIRLKNPKAYDLIECGEVLTSFYQGEISEMEVKFVFMGSHRYFLKVDSCPQLVIGSCSTPVRIIGII